MWVKCGKALMSIAFLQFFSQRTQCFSTFSCGKVGFLRIMSSKLREDNQMDYEGKYFPDEDEEEISEGKRKRKKGKIRRIGR